MIISMWTHESEGVSENKEEEKDDGARTRSKEDRRSLERSRRKGMRHHRKCTYLSFECLIAVYEGSKVSLLPAIRLALQGNRRGRRLATLNRRPHRSSASSSSSVVNRTVCCRRAISDRSLWLALSVEQHQSVRSAIMGGFLLTLKLDVKSASGGKVQGSAS